MLDRICVERLPSTTSSLTKVALPTPFDGAHDFPLHDSNSKTYPVEHDAIFLKHIIMRLRVFAGMLSAVDEGVGNVTKTLKAKGMWPSTIFIVTTDK